MGKSTAALKPTFHLHTLAPVQTLPSHEVILEELMQEREGLDTRIRALQRLIEERDRALEQMTAMRELAERSMHEAEEREAVLTRLKEAVEDRDRHIDGLEAKLLRQAERLKQVESTLKMLAEADEHCVP